MKTNKGITLVSLVVTIIILIILAGVSIHATLGENGILTLAKKAKENMELAQIEEETKLNELYSQLVTGDMDVGDVSHDTSQKIKELQDTITRLEANAENEELRKAIEEKDTQIDSLNSTLSKTTATVAHILKDYTAYSKVQLITGTMVNNTAVNTTLNAGQSYTIPQGYHSGSGKVTATSLSSQTQAIVTASDIAQGKTAWVNDSKVTGTLFNKSVTYAPSTGILTYDLNADTTEYSRNEV